MVALISVVEVSGTHREVGRQIGETLREQIQQAAEKLPADLPAGITWQEMLDHCKLYLAHSRAVLPAYVEELEGLAEGANVSFDAVFLSMCEELWEKAAWREGAYHRTKGCTDMAARGRATVDGSTLLAHTNDLSPGAGENLVVLKVKVNDEPEFLGVSSGGIAISAGYNAAGIGLTGNQVNSNDIRPGVPRLLMVRAILAARHLGQAMDVCLLPQRASNYNNVIGNASGEVYSMEGSALDCEAIYIEDDILAHANHYVTARMRPYEVDRNAISGSILRYYRAKRLLRENHGKLSPQLFQQLLSDHVNYPNSICKHEGESVTVFSIIINLNELRAWVGHGFPCQTKYQEFQLDPWPFANTYD